MNEEGRHAPIRRPSAAVLWPFLFVAVSLVALAVIPVVQDRRIAAIESELEFVLEPALSLTQRLSLSFAEQLAPLQRYLLYGEPASRSVYNRLDTDARRVYRGLGDLISATDLEIREQHAELWDAWQTWARTHEGARQSEPARAAYLPSFYLDQARYEELVQSSQVLESSIERLVARARADMAEERAFQVGLTFILALLALGGTLGLGLIGRRLRDLVGEAGQRRSDALRAQREVTAVMEATGDGVIGLDLEGRCTTLNRTGSELLGISEVDARGRTVHDLLHAKAKSEDSHEETDCPLMRALESGRTTEDANSVVSRRDGSHFPARWQVRPRVDGKDINGAVVTITDMTEIREAEAALRKAVQARDEMVAIVSHDLRSPLGTISAASDLLVELDLPPEKADEQLHIIKRQANRMAGLIRDLLDVARIEAGALRVHPRPLDIASVVADTVEQFASQAAGLGIDLRAEVHPTPQVLAEPGRVDQVLANLVGNALRFTPRGGSIRVGLAPLDDQVEVTVSDTGQGIVPEAVEHLFDRFWQPEQGDAGGTGLGLTIVRGIVEAHGGRIRVESEVGVGTTFFVTMPAEAEQEEAALPEAV